MDEQDIAAPTMPKTGINITDNTRFEIRDKLEENTYILVFLILDIPVIKTVLPMNTDVVNIIIINGIYASSYGPAKINNKGVDSAAIPSAEGMYSKETIFNNILMLDLNACILSMAKNDDNLGINKFDTGDTSSVAAPAITKAKL